MLTYGSHLFVILWVTGLFALAFFLLRPMVTSRSDGYRIAEARHEQLRTFFMLHQELNRLKEGWLSEAAPDFSKNSENAVFESLRVEHTRGTEYLGSIGILQRMPKGGLLNAHEMTLCSPECIIGLTYEENLWACESSNRAIQQLRFSLSEPPAKLDSTGLPCRWGLLNETRLQDGRLVVDERIRKRLSLNQNTASRTQKSNERKSVINYQEALEIADFIKNLITYEPIWKMYHTAALRRFLDEGIAYVEYRTTLPELYDLNGRTYDSLLTARLLLEAVMQLRDPRLMGANMIYMPRANLTQEEYAEFLTNAYKLKMALPDFFVGIDVLNRAETQRQVSDYLEALYSVRRDLNLFFTGGEANVSIARNQGNVIESLGLGCRRIADPSDLPKDPWILRMSPNLDTAIEVSTAMNREDDAPSAREIFLKNGNPVVLTTTFPMFQELPLTMEFHQTFLVSESKNSSVDALKRVAMNSLLYSAMSPSDKLMAMGVWSKQWRDWMEMAHAYYYAKNRKSPTDRRMGCKEGNSLIVKYKV